MSAPRPLEQALLAPVEDLLSSHCSRFAPEERFEARLQLLEATAGRLGSFSTREYFKAFSLHALLDWKTADAQAAQIVAALNSLNVHPGLALSALAREPMSVHAQREAGSYYTDFRLAMLVADLAKTVLLDGRPVIDPACGAGILLAALTRAVCGHDRKKAASWLAKNVHAADMSPLALRGAALSLASFTDDIESLIKMRRNWFCGDTLIRPPEDWDTLAPNGYGGVVANPPWEKVKASRHEFAKSQGTQRHYGSAHTQDELRGYEKAQQDASAYARLLAQRYPLVAGGEVDLYAAFTELMLRLARDGGGIAALLPGGLIRSQSTERLRRTLVDGCSSLSVGVLDNKARFFGIDTRFKFLAVAGRTRRAGAASLKQLELAMYRGTPDGCVPSNPVKMPTALLRELRPDLSLPEVRTQREWRLYSAANRTGTQWSNDDGPWRVHFCREVDMTRQRPHFKHVPEPGALPVVEGRMVQPHRFGAKTYLGGSGRAAQWQVAPIGQSKVAPQFWIPAAVLPDEVRARASRPRAGFCDIAGQTNERSMMASVIPAGHVCGNKVPTVEFSGPTAEADMWLWVGMVNSLPFDWLLRRVLTTTVNYFLLRSVPLPAITSDSLPGRRIVKAAQELARLDLAGSSRETALRVAHLRAEIDVLCLVGYGRSFADLQLMLEDFPLLDRGQPVLAGEQRSSITKDLLLLAAAKRFKKATSMLSKRVESALALGATPYVPAISAGDGADESDEANAAS